MHITYMTTVVKWAITYAKKYMVYLHSKRHWQRSIRSNLLNLHEDWIFVTPEELADTFRDEKILYGCDSFYWILKKKYKLKDTP